MAISVPHPSFRSSHSYLAASLIVLASCSVVAFCPPNHLRSPNTVKLDFEEECRRVRLTFTHCRLKCLLTLSNQELGKAIAIANSLDCDPFSREAYWYRAYLQTHAFRGLVNKGMDNVPKQAEHLFSSFPWQTEDIAVAGVGLFWAWWMMTNILRSFSLNVTVGSCPYYQNDIILAVNCNNKSVMILQLVGPASEGKLPSHTALGLGFYPLLQSGMLRLHA